VFDLVKELHILPPRAGPLDVALHLTYRTSHKVEPKEEKVGRKSEPNERRPVPPYSFAPMKALAASTVSLRFLVID